MKTANDTIALFENDEDSNHNKIPPFYSGLHGQYIKGLAAKLDATTSYEGAKTEHLKMSGVYWSLSALSLLQSSEDVERDMDLISSSSKDKNKSIVDWLFTCYDERTGGFGGNSENDGHLLYTLSAVQILAIADCLDDERFDKQAVVDFVVGLQLPDGSFVGDSWGEVDTRFTYCALSTLSILKSLDRVDVDKAAEYILSCRNLDGGFGSVQGAESHAGQVFCCVGALSIANKVDELLRRHDESADLLGWWLCERQVDSGGLNGRPEKQADVCYSWWILSSLSILGKVSWINRDKLAAFILRAQDDEDGGIADRPDDMPDVFHTFFGIAGLSLLGRLHKHTCTSFRKIDPVYALPTDVVERLSLQAQVLEPSYGEPLDERLAQDNYNIIASNNESN